jgi:hypothetical protein
MEPLRLRALSAGFNSPHVWWLQAFRALPLIILSKPISLHQSNSIFPVGNPHAHAGFRVDLDNSTADER